MRELSLFTGAGGGLLGSMLLGWQTVCAVEWDAYCQRVLCARGGYMADADGEQRRPSRVVTDARADWRHDSGRSSAVRTFAVHGDIRDFHPVPGTCDIVTGGFPCQPFSHAGKRLGEDDPRNMWPHTIRVLRESGAPLGLFENVPGLLSAHRTFCTLHWQATRPYLGRHYCSACRRRVPSFRQWRDYYFSHILRDLAEAGFNAEWCVLGADDVGAPHRRKRLWILAYRQGVREWPGLRAHEQAAERRGRSGDGSSPWSVDPADLPDAARGGQSVLWRPSRDAGQPARDGEDVGHADEQLRQGQRDHARRQSARTIAAPDTGNGDDWLAEPYVGRVAHGVAARVDRLRALGNGQVPQTMAAAFTILARRAGLL